eukprot:NODE_840_length_2738_cov_16.350057.p1 GENE.NODE_840_length_2738_cov_16.350057~~NODE_840_length_2738_cov_16.350057.p1  ORF type:complete len:817 (-),score=164.59 NODE_840_length_2738_cov_16.350057:210-2660(-)
MAGRAEMGSRCNRRARAGQEILAGLTMRFADPVLEHSFVASRSRRIATRFSIAGGAALLFTATLLYVEMTFNIETQYRSATDGSKIIQIRCTVMIVLMSVLACIMVLMRCPALHRVPIMLELLAVMGFMAAVVAVIATHIGILFKLLGLDPETALTGGACNNDTFLLLALDSIVTVSHIFLPVRWFVLWPLEFIVVATYLVPVVMWGSWYSATFAGVYSLSLTLLVVMASSGRRELERQERNSFQLVARERVQRYQVERQLDNLTSHSKPDAETISTQSSTFQRRPIEGLPVAPEEGHQFSVAQYLVKIAELGLREHWLINSSELAFPNSGTILGAGSFGIVVRGVFHGALVAVKALQCAPDKSLYLEKLGSMANELRILRRLRHPRITLLYGAVIDASGGEIALVSEYVNGSILTRFLMASCADEVRHSLILDICSALQYLHELRPPIIHGDLKSGNIMVQCNSEEVTAPHAKLLDFGLSRVLTRRAQPLGGTVAWMAPELLLSARCAPEASADCFSFGRVIFHVVTGQVPLRRLSSAQFKYWARKRRSVPPLDWPVSCAFRDEAEALCDEMLHFDRTSRLPIAEVRSKLLSWRPLGPMASVVLDALTGPSLGGTLQQARQVVTQARSKGKLGVPAMPLQAATGAVTCGSGDGGGAGVGATGNDAADHDDGASNGTGGIPGTGSGNRAPALPLFLPQFAATPDTVKDDIVMDTLASWNCELPATCADACCEFHALLRQELPRAQARLEQLPCEPAFLPRPAWQCPICGSVSKLEQTLIRLECVSCGYHERRSQHFRRGVLSPLAEESVSHAVPRL